MKTQALDSTSKRISMGVAVLTGIILLGAAAYTFMGGSTSKPVNGLKILAAAHSYTAALQQQHQAIPETVPLQVLVDHGLLQPADIGSFAGLQADIALKGTNGAQNVLMRVHLQDGTDLVLLTDGSAQRPAKR